MKMKKAIAFLTGLSLAIPSAAISAFAEENSTQEITGRSIHDKQGDNKYKGADQLNPGIEAVQHRIGLIVLP